MIELQDNDLLFAKVRPNAIIPTKDDENAGYDIYANFDEDYLIIPPHKTVLVPTGIASAVSDKYYLQVHERGSTGSKGIKYSAGVVDSSYRGEIFIALTNTNNVEVVISKFTKYDFIQENELGHLVAKRFGDFDYDTAIMYPYTKAIAQLVVHEVPKMNIKEITYDELKKIPSKRGIGALGSSGK